MFHDLTRTVYCEDVRNARRGVEFAKLSEYGRFTLDCELNWPQNAISKIFKYDSNFKRNV